MNTTNGSDADDNDDNDDNDNVTAVDFFFVVVVAAGAPAVAVAVFVVIIKVSILPRLAGTTLLTVETFSPFSRKAQPKKTAENIISICKAKLSFTNTNLCLNKSGQDFFSPTTMTTNNHSSGFYYQFPHPALSPQPPQPSPQPLLQTSAYAASLLAAHQAAAAAMMTMGGGASETSDSNTPASNNNTQIYAAERDILNGRGNGVQQHPGNVKYQTLVLVNKVS